jgi:hypothetical protein
MAKITVDLFGATVEPSTLEKVASLLGNFSIPRSAIVGVKVVDDPMRATRGIRAPGYAFPGHGKVGTWRHRDGKDYVAVYAGRPAVELTLAGQPYKRVLVSVDDPYTVAAQFGS